MPPENSDVFCGQSTMSVWNEFKTSQGLSVPPPSEIEVMGDAFFVIHVHKWNMTSSKKTASNEKN